MKVNIENSEERMAKNALSQVMFNKVYEELEIDQTKMVNNKFSEIESIIMSKTSSAKLIFDFPSEIKQLHRIHYNHEENKYIVGEQDEGNVHFILPHYKRIVVIPFEFTVVTVETEYGIIFFYPEKNKIFIDWNESIEKRLIETIKMIFEYQQSKNKKP